ncbi:MAG: hypothetical protein LBD18_04745, partial [Treponema sp.]|nr:hypothetical protein [Treponema sp.]
MPPVRGLQRLYRLCKRYPQRNAVHAGSLNITTAQTVTVHIPERVKSAYGVPNLPGTNFDNSST